MIWNPTTKSSFILPKPEGSGGLGLILGSYLRGFLGYDPSDGKYKVVCILVDNKTGIFTLGAQSWRIITNDCSVRGHIPTCGRCINGVIYYEVLCGLRPMKHAVMSFDLRSEKFSVIQYTMDYNNARDFLYSYEGRLALVRSIDSGVELWILENHHHWIRKHFPSPPPPYDKWVLKGVTDAGEFIYVHTQICEPAPLNSTERSLYESISVVYFDPKKNSTREVKFKGIVVDDIRRPADHFIDLFVIPNHIESFMTLKNAEEIVTRELAKLELR